MRSVLLAVLAAGLLLPAGAAAQSSPFAPLPQAQSDTTTTTTPTTTGVQAQQGGISDRDQTLLIGGGIILVLGIGFLIARDARKNAPVDPRAARPYETETVDGVGEMKKRDPKTQAKQKAAAKRARQARKKNRPVRK